MKEKNKNDKQIVLTAEETEKKKLLRRKRIIAVISLVIVIALVAWLTVFVTKSILSVGEGEDASDVAMHFKELILSYGNWGLLVAFGIQCLQVIVSPIPGEVIETGMGLVFGPWIGALICLAGVALSSYLIMLFVRKFGTKFVELFISLDKINDLKFLNSEKKLERAVLILYLLPGTPKDPLIFFFGLTKIKISTFIVFSTLARIPSVITSTIGGHLITEKRYLEAVILYIIIGLISLVCILLYKKILNALDKRHNKNKADNNSENTEEENHGTDDAERLQVAPDTEADAGGDKKG